MLTSDDLDLWVAQVGRALYDSNITIGPAHYQARVVGAGRGKPEHALISFDCPHWVRGRRAAIELRVDGATRWTGPDASVRAMGERMRTTAPKWHVPPTGDVPFVVALIERNGWEGESWTFYMPLEHERSVRALVDLHVPSEGRDMRVTPFDPPSLARFGSWSLTVGYLRADLARTAAERSNAGYMRYRSWCPSAGPALDLLIERARARDLMTWDQENGLHMWKGHVSLSVDKVAIRNVHFVHELAEVDDAT